VNPSYATLAHDRHALLPGHGGQQALYDDRRPVVAGGGVGSRGEESRAEPAEIHDVADLAQEVAWLRRRLLTQPAIEQAKGLLIGYYGVDTETAFAVLVRWSQHSNTKLHVLAAGLVAAATESCGQPHAGLRRFIQELPAPTALLAAGTPSR
jgi:hypothetical protein